MIKKTYMMRNLNEKIKKILIVIFFIELLFLIFMKSIYIIFKLFKVCELFMFIKLKSNRQNINLRY